MSPTSWFNEYIAKKTPGAEWNSREDFTLRLCMKYADDAACAQYVLASADAFIQADKCTPANAGALFFALDKTGEEKYREAIRQVMAKLNEQDAVAGLVEACLRDLQTDALEPVEMPHAQTIELMRQMDALRAEWGMKFPYEKELPKA